MIQCGEELTERTQAEPLEFTKVECDIKGIWGRKEQDVIEVGRLANDIHPNIQIGKIGIWDKGRIHRYPDKNKWIKNRNRPACLDR